MERMENNNERLKMRNLRHNLMSNPKRTIIINGSDSTNYFKTFKGIQIHLKAGEYIQNIEKLYNISKMLLENLKGVLYFILPYVYQC